MMHPYINYNDANVYIYNFTTLKEGDQNKS